MNDKLEKLQQQHRDKTLEIEEAIAQALGIGVTEAKQEAENLIDGFENAMLDGETPKEWQAHEVRLTATPIPNLLVERYEIAEQILDVEDEHVAARHDR